MTAHGAAPSGAASPHVTMLGTGGLCSPKHQLHAAVHAHHHLTDDLNNNNNTNKSSNNQQSSQAQPQSVANGQQLLTGGIAAAMF